MVTDPSNSGGKTHAINNKIGSTAKIRDQVFIVHGRDELPKQTVARWLESNGLKPIILHEQHSDGSTTIIEKFEKYASNLNFAIVILTPDDLGRLKDEDFKNEQPRARQNVILELGYFLGYLGRDRVCCLYKDTLEIPSDFDGVVYIPFNRGVEEVYGQLGRELDNSGFKITKYY